MVLTALSRFGYLSLLGVSVVLTDSMAPTLRPGDMVFYLNANYTVGDVVVYCLTPSHCVVHRVVDLLFLDTVSGYRAMVITKGDNINITDSPVGVEQVRGRVVFSVPRELWIPIAMAILAYALYSLARAPIVGYSYTILFSVALASVVAVYATVPRPIEQGAVRSPVVNLAGVYFEPQNCYVRVRYRGELSLTSVDVEVNSTKAEVVLLDDREVVLRPSLDLLRKSFEHGEPLRIAVRASLNRVGRLFGEYTLLVGGLDPEIDVSSGVLVVRNPNCFPVSVNVSVRYPSEGGWLWSNRTYIIRGFSYVVVESPSGASYSYVYVYWFNQGDRRWVGLPLRTG